MSWKLIAVDRDILTVDRHYYDLYLNNDGLGGNYLWKTGSSFRTPFSKIKDFFLRKKYSSMSPEEAVKFNPNNFFIKYDEIQGVVNDDIHKMFEVLTSKELIRIIFRKIPQYESFSKAFSEKIGDKMHNKEKEVKISVKQGYK